MEWTYNFHYDRNSENLVFPFGSVIVHTTEYQDQSSFF